jgi:hypothetical protein
MSPRDNDSPNAMKPSAWLIVLSVSANVLLAGWWSKGRSVSSKDRIPAASDLTTDPSLLLRHPKPVTSRTDSASSPEPVWSGPAASWKDLQTDDLKEFVQRLRAAGCPEETVQDLILAEVNRRYAILNRELWPERNVDKPFWEVQKGDPAEAKRNRERSRKAAELRKEKSALLIELLGVDPEKERRRAEGLADYSDYNERRVSFLPEAKREAVVKFLDEFEDKMQDFYTRNRGLYDSQYRAERKQLEEERSQALAQFLTPEEIREFELRQSQLASQLSHDLRGLTVSREQYDAIYDVRKKYGDSIYNYGDLETKAERDQVAKNKEALQADLVAALGPDKAREYQRSQDYSYQELTRLARRNDLPVETAAKVYDFKEAAEASVKQIKADTTLTEEQRKSALSTIREETQQAVRDSLGAGFTNYLRQGGWWINNLAPGASTR